MAKFVLAIEASPVTIGSLELSLPEDLDQLEQLVAGGVEEFIVASEDEDEGPPIGLAASELEEGRLAMQGVERAVARKSEALPTNERPKIYTKQFAPTAGKKAFSDPQSLLTDADLDAIEAAAKGCDKFKIYLFGHFRKESGMFAAGSYYPELLAEVFIKLADRGITPDKLCVVACQFGDINWTKDATERNDPFWNFLERVVESPQAKREGLLISAFRAAVFPDPDGRKMFAFGAEYPQYKENLASEKQKKGYKTFIVYDTEKDRFIEATRRDYTAKPDLSNVDAVFYAEEELVTCNRVIRNELGTSKYKIRAPEENIKGKLLFLGDSGDAYFHQVSPKADPAKIIRVASKHGEFNFAGAENEYFDLSVTKEKKVITVDATRLNYTKLQKLILQISEMTDAQIANYCRVRKPGGLETPYSADNPGVVAKKNDDGSIYIQCADNENHIRLFKVLRSQIPSAEMAAMIDEMEIGAPPPDALVDLITKLDKSERAEITNEQQNQILSEVNQLKKDWTDQPKPLLSYFTDDKPKAAQAIGEELYWLGRTDNQLNKDVRLTTLALKELSEELPKSRERLQLTMQALQQAYQVGKEQQKQLQDEVNKLRDSLQAQFTRLQENVTPAMRPEGLLEKIQEQQSQLQEMAESLKGDTLLGKKRMKLLKEKMGSLGTELQQHATTVDGLIEDQMFLQTMEESINDAPEDNIANKLPESASTDVDMTESSLSVTTALSPTSMPPDSGQEFTLEHVIGVIGQEPDKEFIVGKLGVKDCELKSIADCPPGRSYHKREAHVDQVTGISYFKTGTGTTNKPDVLWAPPDRSGRALARDGGKYNINIRLDQERNKTISIVEDVRQQGRGLGQGGGGSRN